MISQPEDPQEPVEGDTASHAGAVEDVSTDRPADSVEELTENISEGEENELPVGGDWSEGQTNADDKDLPDDETRQST